MVRVRKMTTTIRMNAAQYNLSVPFTSLKKRRLSGLKKYMNPFKNIHVASTYINYFERARTRLKHACSMCTQETKPNVNGTILEHLYVNMSSSYVVSITAFCQFKDSNLCYIFLFTRVVLYPALY